MSQIPFFVVLFHQMRVRTTSALLLRARLLKLGFELHREVVARVVVVPALLPQVCRRGLGADFLFLGPVCAHTLASNPVEMVECVCLRTFYREILKLVILLELCAGLLRLEGLAGVF
jgi:hypothetical protein